MRGMPLLWLVLVAWICVPSNGQSAGAATQGNGVTCVDQQSTAACQRLKKFGWCQLRKTRMQVTCAGTCGFCGDVCSNKLSMRCRKWVYFGACVTHRNYMMANCKKMCGFCRASADIKIAPNCSQSKFGCCWDKSAAPQANGKGCPGCTNKLQLCQLFYEDCVAGSNMAIMHSNCAKTCRLCNKYGYTPVYAQ